MTTMTATHLPPLVGRIEVADLLGVPTKTVRTWLHRQLMPDPLHEHVNGGPVWKTDTIVAWAGATGRLSDEAVARWPQRAVLAARHREAFGEPQTSTYRVA